MPIFLPRKRASASSLSFCRSSPATTTEPLSARSSPVITISSVDLPDPDGPSRPTASPRPIFRSMSLEDMHPRRAAAEREVDAAQRHRIASERMPRRVIHVCSRPAPVMGDAWQVIWVRERLAPNAACCRAAALCCVLLAARRGYRASRRPSGDRPSRSWRSAIRLTAGFGLPRSDGFVPRLQAALSAKGLAAELDNAGVSGDTARGGTRAARLVGAAGHRRRDPRARRQRHAARNRSAGDLHGARRDSAAAEPTPYRRSLVRHAGHAQPRRRLCALLRAIYPELAAKYGVLLYPFFLDGSAADLTLRQADGLHPNAAGVNAIVAHILPKVQELIAQIRQLTGAAGLRGVSDALMLRLAANCRPRGAGVMPRLFTGLEIPPQVAQSLADDARRAAGRALDRSGELSPHAALHRRHRRRPGARHRQSPRRRAARAVRASPRRAFLVRRPQAARIGRRGGAGRSR